MPREQQRNVCQCSQCRTWAADAAEAAHHGTTPPAPPHPATVATASRERQRLRITGEGWTEGVDGVQDFGRVELSHDGGSMTLEDVVEMFNRFLIASGEDVVLRVMER